jgi:hypothetical protein
MKEKKYAICFGKQILISSYQKKSETGVSDERYINAGYNGNL